MSQPFLVTDPHAGRVDRAVEVWREAVAEEEADRTAKRKTANTFMLIGIVLMAVSGYIGYLLGR